MKEIIYREVPTYKGDPWGLPLGALWTLPPYPASPGCGRLEVPRRLRVSNQNRRWGLPVDPSGAPLSAITLSFQQDTRQQQWRL